MSLADQISATAQAGPGWQECSVSWALRVLPPADAAALRQVLAAPTPPRYYELEAALTDQIADLTARYLDDGGDPNLLPTRP